MAVGDFEPWTVYYKAVADFSDLIKEAAKARAEMAALTKDMSGMNKAVGSDSQRAATSIDSVTRAIQGERTALDQTARSAQNYNQQVLFGGRRSMDQHLQDLQKQTTLQTLLNRARQRGFITPQQDYAFRQREYQAMLLWNRASQQGYTTPDQYLGFLQKERTNFDAMTRSWRSRDLAMRSATDAAIAYARKVGGVNVTPGGLATSAAGVNSLGDALSGLPDQVSTKVTLNDSSATQDLSRYAAGLEALPDTITTDTRFDDSQSLGDLAAYAKALQAIPDVIHTRIDLQKLPTLGPTGPVNIRVNPVIGKITAPHLAAINENINFGSTGAGGDAKQLSALSQSMLTYIKDAHEARQATSALSGSLQTGTHAADELAAAATQAAGSGGSGGGGLAGLTAAAAASGNSARYARGWWSLLTKQIDLFAGAHQIGLWHVLLDLAVEFAAVVVPAAVTAAIGLTAFGAAALKTYLQVYSQLKSIYIVSTATNQAIAPMTDHFKTLQKAVQPDVLQQYGMALMLIQQQGGLVSRMAITTGGVLDRFSARITYAMTHGTGALNKFIKTGQTDLALFGSEAASIGSIFMNFVKASEMTHIAEDILMVFAAVLKVTSAFINMVGPVGLAIGVGAHAAYVYGGLLVTGLQKAGIGFTKVGALISKLSGSFMGLERDSYNAARALGASDAALGKMAARSTGIQAISKATGVASGELGTFYRESEKTGTSLEDTARASTKGQTAIFKYGQGLNKAGTDAVAMAGYLGATDKEISQVAGSMEKAAARTSLFSKAGSKLATTFGGTGGIVALIAAVGAATVYLGIKFGDAADATKRWISEMNTNISQTPIYALAPKLASDIVNVASALDKATVAAKRQASTPFGGGRQDLANLTIAASKARALGSQYTLLGGQLKLVTTRTQQLGQMFGGSLVRGMGAATQAGITNQQLLSKDAKVWAEALIQVNAMIKGYELFGQKAGALGNDIDAVTYAQSNQLKQMKALNDAWDTFTKNVSGPRDTFEKFAGDISVFNKDAGLAGAAMTGLGTNALQLQGDFQGTYADANKLLDTLRTAGAPSATFTKVAKEIVQSLIPLAGRSKAARAEISVLAQEAGGPATTSIKALTTWAGKSKNPLQGMAKATDTVVIATSNLSEQAKRVSASLQNYVNQALVVAELKTLGFAKALQHLTNVQNDPNHTTKQLTDAQKALANIIKVATGRAQDEANKLAGMTKAASVNAEAIKKNNVVLKDQVSWLSKNGVAAGNATDALKTYTNHIMDNTTQTDAGKNARKVLYNDYFIATGNSKDAMKALNNYTAQIQLNKDKTAGGHNVRKQLIQDFIDAHTWNIKTKDSLDTYTQFIRNNTDKTNAGRNARSQLIKDLEKTGINAKTARGLVDKLTGSIKNIPKTRSLVIGVTGGGKYKITQTTAGPNPIFKTVPTRAEGGPIVSPGRQFQRVQGSVDMTAGTPGRDSVPAIVMPGEYVIKTSAVQKYGKRNMERLNNMQLAEGGYIPRFSLGGPAGGGSAGGYNNPLRRISGLQPERVDMGVDYGGTGPVMAVGPGVITNVYNSGWPSGTFISERMSSGPAAGKYIYEAETINPRVRKGQQVNANTVTSYMHGPASIEIGWAAPPGSGLTMAAQAGQQAHSGDPGDVATGYGVSFNNFLKGLGAPGGIVSGRVSGKVPKGFNFPGGGAPAIKLKPLIKELTGSFHEKGSIGSGPASQAFPDLGHFQERADHSSVAMAEYNMEASLYNAIAKKINASNASFGGSSGPASPGLLTVAHYLMSHGYGKAAAAGMAGVVGGEAGPSGSPESVGSGGAGLIGWTPPSAMIRFGGTSHAAGIGHNSTNVDMGNQLSAMVKWASAFGFPPGVANRYHDPMNAAYAASAAYERPLVPGSDVHSSIIMGVFNRLAKGGMVQDFFNGGDVVKAVTQATKSNPVREAMLMGSYLQSRWNPSLQRKGGAFGAWGTGPGKPPAPKMTKSTAMNPYAAAKALTPGYITASRRAGFGLQPADSETAFLNAQQLKRSSFSSAAVHDGWDQIKTALGLDMKGKPIPGPGGGGKGPPLVKWLTRTADGKHHLAALAAATDKAVPWSQVIAHNKWARKYEGKNIPKGWKVSLPFPGNHSVPPPNSGKPLPNQDGGQKWQAAENALLTAWTNEKSKMATFDSASAAKWFPSPKHMTKRQAKHWSGTRSGLLKRVAADEKLLKSRQATLVKDMAKITAGKNNGRVITEHEWDLVGTDINKLQGAMGHVPLLYKHEPDRGKNAWAALAKLKKASARGHSTWDNLWGPNGSLMPKHYPGTPGPFGLGGVGDVPSHKILNVPPLSSLLPVSPVKAPVFAAGGLVMSGAGPSMPSSSFSTIAMPTAMAQGGTVEPARKISAAGQAAGGGGDRIGIKGDVHIHNPKAERPSESIARTVQRTAFLAGRGMA